MTLKTFATATLLLALASSSPASAGVSATYVFETVDSYDISGDAHEVKVTGIIQGEATLSTVTLQYWPNYYSTPNSDTISSKRTFDRCERLILLAMSKPGQYLLELRQEHNTFDPHIDYIGCKLTRR
jgi:hypothetical protein